MSGLRNRTTTLTNVFLKSSRHGSMQSQALLLSIVDRGGLRLMIVRKDLQMFGSHRIAGQQTIVPRVIRNVAITWLLAISFRMPVQLFFGKPFTKGLAARTRAYVCAEIGSSGRRWL